MNGQSAWGQKELRVAAAADLQPVMPALAQRYEHETGIKLLVSFGSSSTLVTQILNGAPFDIFLAADYVFPEKIVMAGLADGAQPTPYAKGTLVLWTRKDSGLLPLTLDTLSDPRVKTIAIANELHAPYGRAAAAALRRMKLYDQVAPHLVVGENISQTAQFVESGNAQLGLISLTAASTQHFKEIGTYILVPTSQYPEIRQCAVIMAKSEHKAEAHIFFNWLLSPAIQGDLPQVGLRPVQ
ncbi:molybdate ABC transporter substrate-binding protein [Tunturibacter empetritectus]|uniref:Molybdate transport system substrate-binding protein n=1 Tax=Tunturiibacter lichenicola TaxID=2051959 RepID=A0A7W8N249_9BACT|nr:molybdate ABC transporter substrate-binding protein [Edaphobacter lichenicola]MBB5343022.1 molybdate transport system substrate-binding protein [Edaphobacter lichenicola]